MACATAAGHSEWFGDSELVNKCCLSKSSAPAVKQWQGSSPDHLCTGPSPHRGAPAVPLFGPCLDIRPFDLVQCRPNCQLRLPTLLQGFGCLIGCSLGHEQLRGAGSPMDAGDALQSTLAKLVSVVKPKRVHEAHPLCACHGVSCSLGLWRLCRLGRSLGRGLLLLRCLGLGCRLGLGSRLLLLGSSSLRNHVDPCSVLTWPPWLKRQPSSQYSGSTPMWGQPVWRPCSSS